MFNKAALSLALVFGFAVSAGAVPSAPAVAKSPLGTGFFCSTDPHLTTLYSATPNKDELVIDFMHFNGVDFMPVHEGVIVPHDLPILAERAAVLKSLGTQLRFRFPKSGCQEFGGKLIRCDNFKGEAQTINGRKVRGLMTYTAKIETSSFVGTYEHFATSLYIDVDGQPYTMTMKYVPEHCRFLDEVN